MERGPGTNSDGGRVHCGVSWGSWGVTLQGDRPALCFWHGQTLASNPLFQDGAEPAPDGREQCLWHGRVAPGK